MKLDDDLSSAEFRDIKAQFQPEIDRLSQKNIEAVSLDSNYKKYLDDGFGLLKHFASEYNRATLDVKQKLIG
jgi:hypothetical protein